MRRSRSISTGSAASLSARFTGAVARISLGGAHRPPPWPVIGCRGVGGRPAHHSPSPLRLTATATAAPSACPPPSVSSALPRCGKAVAPLVLTVSTTVDETPCRASPQAWNAILDARQGRVPIPCSGCRPAVRLWMALPASRLHSPGPFSVVPAATLRPIRKAAGARHADVHRRLGVAHGECCGLRGWLSRGLTPSIPWMP